MTEQHHSVNPTMPGDHHHRRQLPPLRTLIIASPIPHPHPNPETASDKRCRRCSKTQLAIYLTTLAVLAIVMGLVIIYFPETSSVELISITVPKFKPELHYPEVHVHSTWEIKIRITNQDKRWKASYRSITCTLYNEEAKGLRKIGSAAIKPFGLAARGRKTVAATMEVHHNRSVHSWEFRRFSVRLEADTEFETAAARLEAVVMGSESVDATCGEIRMVFDRESGRLQQDMKKPKVCEEEMPFDKLITKDDDKLEVEDEANLVG